MIHIYDTYYSDEVMDEEIYTCLKCEYNMCEDCKLFNNTDDKELDINNGESD